MGGLISPSYWHRRWNGGDGRTAIDLRYIGVEALAGRR